MIYAFGQICAAEMAKYLRNNLAIWSPCLWGGGK